MRRILVLNAKGGCGKTTIATNLAAAFAARGEDVALADADRQKSSLGWLKRRPDKSRRIMPLNWTKAGSIGAGTDDLDTIVIDGPGGLNTDHAKTLIAEASDIVVPVLPSVFDWNATLKFLDRISEIKRVRKGKADIHVIANRVNRSSGQLAELEQMFAAKGYPVLGRIADRVVYARHACDGTSIFDTSDARSAEARGQWIPLLQAVDA
ncbi:ParA family protein [Roseibium sediminis]|uniref:ParA family protein n=1 Tax=Roseibium sediminis TaxID=1775174 RepID=UPI00123D3A76|nr:ParA family protein [Roseibium sediminis]